MTLKEIGYLLTVAQCPSISEAAKQLYVAQPSLTHVIQSVEREVGFRIFERGRSGVTVTEQGEEFLSDIRSVYQQMEVIQSKYVEKRPERKNFSFSMQHFSLAGGAFLRFLQELREPCYTARCLEGGTAAVIADVAAGRSEIGFLRFTDEEEPVVRKELRNEKLEFYSIQRTEPCVLLRRDHPLAERESLSRQDLEAYPLVSYDYGTDGAVSLAEEGVTRLQAERRVMVSDGLMLLHLLSSTQVCAVGMAFLPELLEKNGIVIRALEGVRPLRLGWIKKADTVLQPATRRYLQMLSPD